MNHGNDHHVIVFRHVRIHVGKQNSENGKRRSDRNKHKNLLNLTDIYLKKNSIEQKLGFAGFPQGRETCFRRGIEEEESHLGFSA